MKYTLRYVPNVIQGQREILGGRVTDVVVNNSGPFPSLSCALRMARIKLEVPHKAGFEHETEMVFGSNGWVEILDEHGRVVKTVTQ